LRHPQALDGRDPDQNVHLVEHISPGKLIQPGLHPIDVIDQVGLEKLRPGIDLLLFA
jgi:hypothetical protein